ncbi:MAG TPA: hypothetical protein VFB50_06915 [Chloroflexota bacterium]|nr:hypothetical protein [Chloroflexota bacterium]
MPTQEELQELRQMQVALLIQIDQVERNLQRLRWWTLTLAILLVCLAVVIWRLA